MNILEAGQALFTKEALPSLGKGNTGSDYSSPTGIGQTGNLAGTAPSLGVKPFGGKVMGMAGAPKATIGGMAPQAPAPQAPAPPSPIQQQPQAPQPQPQQPQQPQAPPPAQAPQGYTPLLSGVSPQQPQEPQEPHQYAADELNWLSPGLPRQPQQPQEPQEPQEPQQPQQPAQAESGYDFNDNFQDIYGAGKDLMGGAGEAAKGMGGSFADAAGRAQQGMSDIMNRPQEGDVNFGPQDSDLNFSQEGQPPQASDVAGFQQTSDLTPPEAGAPPAGETLPPDQQMQFGGEVPGAMAPSKPRRGPGPADLIPGQEASDLDFPEPAGQPSPLQRGVDAIGRGERPFEGMFGGGQNEGPDVGIQAAVDAAGQQQQPGGGGGGSVFSGGPGHPARRPDPMFAGFGDPAPAEYGSEPSSPQEPYKQTPTAPSADPAGEMEAGDPYADSRFKKQLTHWDTVNKGKVGTPGATGVPISEELKGRAPGMMAYYQNMEQEGDRTLEGGQADLAAGKEVDPTLQNYMDRREEFSSGRDPNAFNSGRSQTSQDLVQGDLQRQVDEYQA